MIGYLIWIMALWFNPTDLLSQPSYQQVSFQGDYVLQGSSGSAVNIKILPDDHAQKKLLFSFFMFQLFLLAYLKISFSRDLSNLVKGLLNINVAQQLCRDQEASMPFSAMLYNLNFVCSLSIYLYLLNDYYHFISNHNEFTLFLYIFTFVLIVYSLKFAVLKLVSVIFSFREEINNYNFNFFLIYKLAGLGLIPLNLLIAYAPGGFENFLINLSFVVVVALHIVIGYKGILVGQKFLLQNKLHFFLYICTLEIAPLFIMYKVLSVLV